MSTYTTLCQKIASHLQSQVAYEEGAISSQQAAMMGAAGAVGVLTYVALNSMENHNYRLLISGSTAVLTSGLLRLLRK